MKGGVKMIIVLIILVSFLAFVKAGPYGYGDSMDLKYKVDNSTIIYGYGDSIKYETSLRPKDKNWSEWKKNDTKIHRGKVIYKSWKEVLKEEKLNKLKKNKSKVKKDNGIKISKKGIEYEKIIVEKLNKSLKIRNFKH